MRPEPGVPTRRGALPPAAAHRVRSARGPRAGPGSGRLCSTGAGGPCRLQRTPGPRARGRPRLRRLRGPRPFPPRTRRSPPPAPGLRARAEATATRRASRCSHGDEPSSGRGGGAPLASPRAPSMPGRGPHGCAATGERTQAGFRARAPGPAFLKRGGAEPQASSQAARAPRPVPCGAPGRAASSGLLHGLARPGAGSLANPRPRRRRSRAQPHGPGKSPRGDGPPASRTFAGGSRDRP